MVDNERLYRGPAVAEIILLFLILGGAALGGLCGSGVLPPASNSPMSTEVPAHMVTPKPAPTPTSTPIRSSYLAEGRQLYDQGLFDLAMVQFTNAIQIDPNYAVAYGWRASAYYSIRQYQRGDADWDTACRLDKQYC